MNKRSSVFSAAVAAVVLLSVSLPALPEAVEGREYAPLSPAQAPETAGKVEVIEFFSYGCPHCNHLHPLISKWSAQLPADVNFVRVPVSMGHPQWGQLVRAYYALQATGDLARLDSALFEAIHQEKQPLFNEATLTAWAAQHGVDAAQFTAAFNSFNVSTKSSHAEQLARDYRVDGIPKIVVAGKYVVLGNNFELMLANASQVISKATQGSQGTKAGK